MVSVQIPNCLETSLLIEQCAQVVFVSLEIAVTGNDIGYVQFVVRQYETAAEFVKALQFGERHRLW